ncbi:hypothetical protein [Acidithiobacillus sp.]|uniref:hypothetical protein n=1 Tax=Acidithiobacillus sp. TaxID=1872118 RepID=UPI00261FEB1B|nr:hypothetical protein [Acidithiobacillus sp.]MDD5279429.1 hypothetical protein [Acidithiobacillus sp.]
MNVKYFGKIAALAATLGCAGLLTASPAFAWGWAPWNDMPWSGYSSPFSSDSGPFSGYGGPFTGNSGPWDMGSMSFNGPHGGPMQFSSGRWGGYSQPYNGYYGGGYGGGYRDYAPENAYPPAESGYPAYGNYNNADNNAYIAPSAPPQYANNSQQYAPPPGPYRPGYGYP